MKRWWAWPAVTVATTFVVGVIMRDVWDAAEMSGWIAAGSLVGEVAGRLLKGKS